MIEPRRYAGELATVGSATLGALAILWMVDTQAYTEPWTVDPWLYTALMTNFDSIYGWFSSTYYASRLPAILPGLFLNSFLSPEHAYLVLHLVMYIAGGVFLYLIVRFLFGVSVALFVYPVFLLNATYVDAHTWDYIDGFVITYVAGGSYFLLSSVGRRSRVRLVLAGFLFAAATATNLFASLLILGATAAYLYGRHKIEGRLRVAVLARDAAWFAVGAVLLLGACAAFARQHGGRTLFFMPSIDAARTISTDVWKLPSYDWVVGEPRLLVPPFVVAAVLLAWSYRRRSTRDALGLALTVAVAAIFLLLAYWELARSGTFLQLTYYFDMLYPFLFVALATALFSLVGLRRNERPLPRAAVAGLGLVVGAIPLLAVYGFERGQLWGRRGSVVTVLVLAAALLATAALRVPSTRRFASTVAPCAAALAVLGVNYASAASATTHGQFETANSSLAEADEVFSMGIDLIEFMRDNGLQEAVPGFWYDESADPAMTGLQSLYFYGFTLLNREMPKIDSAFQSVIASREPMHVVFLCIEPTCRNGASAMRRAGYGVHPVAETQLSAGTKSVWVRAYSLDDI